jgi:hypothetical protein
MSQPSSRLPRFRLVTLATLLAASSLSACIVVPPHRHYSRGVAVEGGGGYGHGSGRVWVDGYWQQSPRGRIWIEGHWSGR